MERKEVLGFLFAAHQYGRCKTSFSADRLRSTGLEGKLRAVYENGPEAVVAFIKEERLKEQLIEPFFDYEAFMSQKVTLNHNTGSLFLKGIQEHGLNVHYVDDMLTFAVDFISSLSKRTAKAGVFYAGDNLLLKKKKISLSLEDPDLVSATKAYPAVLYEELNPDAIQEKQKFYDMLTSEERPTVLSIFQYGDELRAANHKIELQCELTPQDLRDFVPVGTKEETTSLLAESSWFSLYVSAEKRKEHFANNMELFLEVLSYSFRHAKEYQLPSVSSDLIYYRGKPISDLVLTGPDIGDFTLQEPQGDLKSYLEL